MRVEPSRDAADFLHRAGPGPGKEFTVVDGLREERLRWGILFAGVDSVERQLAIRECGADGIWSGELSLFERLHRWFLPICLTEGKITKKEDVCHLEFFGTGCRRYGEARIAG